jgi:hypothetical protein
MGTRETRGASGSVGFNSLQILVQDSDTLDRTQTSPRQFLNLR